MRIKPSYLLLLLLIAASCESDPTTYQIVNNKEFVVSENDPLVDGSLYEVVVFVYFEDDIVRQDNVSAVAPDGGVSSTFEVPETCEKIRISFTSAPSASESFRLAEGARQWVGHYDTLEIGRNNRIIIDDSTHIRYVYDFK